MASLNAHGFSTSTVDDHRPWLWTVTLLGCIYSVFSLGARIVSKWGFLGYDDAIISAAQLVAIGHYAALGSAVSAGLGAAQHALTPHNFAEASRSYFASRPLFYAALFLAKLSVVAFSRRIYSGNLSKEKILFGGTTALVVIWGVLAIVLSTAGCHPHQALVATENGFCSAQKARWIVVLLLDIVTELMLMAVPIWLVFHINIHLSKKIVVAVVFSFRLLVIAFSICNTTSYFQFFDSHQNSIGLAVHVAWQEVYLGVSLVTASIPALRTFLWAFMSRGMYTMYGLKSSSASQYAPGSKTRSRSRSIPMIPIKTKGSTVTSAREEHDGYQDGRYVNGTTDALPSPTRADVVGYTVGVHGAMEGMDEAASIESESSNTMIIRPNTGIQVRTEYSVNSERQEHV